MPGKVGNTNASHRRKMAREALRLRIKGEKCIDELIEIRESLKEADAPVPALKARADLEFGLLKKILPDLRSVEHSGEAGAPIPVSMIGLTDLTGAGSDSDTPET